MILISILTVTLMTVLSLWFLVAITASLLQSWIKDLTSDLATTASIILWASFFGLLYLYVST